MRVRPDSFLEDQLPHCPLFWVSSSYKALLLQMMFKNCTFSKSQGRDLCGVPYNSSSHLPSGPGRGDLIPFRFCAAGWGLYLKHREAVPPAPCFTSCVSNSSFPTSCMDPESLHTRCSSNPVLLITVHPKQQRLRVLCNSRLGMRGHKTIPGNWIFRQNWQENGE